MIPVCPQLKVKCEEWHPLWSHRIKRDAIFLHPDIP